MSTLTGTATCLKLAWRRNRLFWALWVLALAVMMPMTASQYDTIIPPGTDPGATIEPLRHNPSMLALLGPAFDLYSKGGFVYWRVGGFTACFAGMMAGFGIIRATRAEEEVGRLELIRSGIVGRHAPLAAGIALGALASLVLALLTTAFAIASGLPTAGSIAAGAGFAGTALVFTGIGAVFAQVDESARTARFWTLGLFFGGMFLARMMIDGSPDASWVWTRWIVPMEWAMLVRPYAGERWWVLALPLALFALLTALAFALESRRDHGAGLRSTRPGRSSAPASLAGAWGLAARLHRGSAIAWTIGLLVCSLGTGSIMAQMQDSVESNPQMAEMMQKMGGTKDFMVAFYVAMVGIMATVVAIMAASAVLRLRGEETRGHSEMLLATATSRTEQALSHLAWALVAPGLALVAVGAVMPLTQAADTGDWGLVGRYAASAGGLLPGLVLVVGLTMLLVGWLPRLTALVWLVLGWTMFATWFAVLFDIPQWVTRITPWGHLSAVPRDAMNWTPFAIELFVGLALVALGLVGYRRRGIPA